MRVFYDTANGKKIVVDGLFGRGVSVNTDEENEEDLLKKIGGIVEWVGNDNSFLIEEVVMQGEKIDELLLTKEVPKSENELTEVLPEEILWIRLDTGIIEGIEVKSYILISLPSVAQFIGTKSDQLTEWLSQTTFFNYVLSAHPKKVNGPEISGSLKKGVVKGYIPLIPFELLPEIIITFRQSNRAVSYPEKAEMLYKLAKTTLEAVGLAVSGNRDRAAEELARVGQGLGLTAADQIIALFKQYESRDFQVRTTKEFQSRVRQLKLDYATTIGKLTLGITNRSTGHWKLLGTMRKLPKAVTDSSREVMRKVSPSDGVGMTFGERHFIKDPDMEEAIETGRQGKDFYQRLKKVGLLD